MSDEPRLSADEVMDQARCQFLAAARGTLDSFAQLGEALAAKPAGEDTLLSMQRELHRLHGSAATFGFPRVGRMAAALESAIKKWAADPMLDPDRRAPIVARFVDSLRQQLAGDAGTNGTTPALGGHRLLLVGLKDVVAVPLTTEASSRGFQDRKSVV